MKFILIGIAGGILGGMGMGGGTLTIPLLTMLGGLKQHIAQAINLASFIPMAVIALILHFKNKLVKTEGILFIIIPALVFSVISSLIIKNINSVSLSRLFGVFLAVLGVWILIENIFINKNSKKTKDNR
ncbi:MAG TPA: sulfite exporter TauE/SafE family protein [Clostridiales bacterium]|nr:sulfite exporter TauE/SafE family protein [Clostridiales bacterium]